MCYRVGDTKTFGLAVPFLKLRKSPNVSDLPPSFWFPVASHTEGVGASVMHRAALTVIARKGPGDRKHLHRRIGRGNGFLCGRIPVEHFEQCWRSKKKRHMVGLKPGVVQGHPFLGWESNNTNLWQILGDFLYNSALFGLVSISNTAVKKKQLILWIIKEGCFHCPVE